MQDEQNLERVRVTFEKFNIPMNEKQCNDGYLKVSWLFVENVNKKILNWLLLLEVLQWGIVVLILDVGVEENVGIVR